MDLINIGKYIAGQRNELGLTQRQLAEKLGMSDKSVSKWERGVCLPDVSVYSELCSILGISINEFLAGEDIAQENIVRKSEENIIGVATDSNHRQKYLKRIIRILLAILIAAVGIVGTMFCLSNRPVNEISPVDRNSVEGKTAEMFSGPDGIFIYNYTTTDEYSSLNMHISGYRAGVLIDENGFDVGVGDAGSPKNGKILLVPDLNNRIIKIIIAWDDGKMSTDVPILLDIPEGEPWIGSYDEIHDTVDIRYNEEQALVALFYDTEELHALDLCDIMDEDPDALAVNDYVYLFSFEFCNTQS